MTRGRRRDVDPSRAEIVDSRRLYTRGGKRRGGGGNENVEKVCGERVSVQIMRVEKVR